jgi:hypothetical protein
LGGGGAAELGDPVEDEPPDPFAAPGLAALELAALAPVLVNGRAAKAPVPPLQPQPQNARAIRKNRARKDSEF